MPPRIVLLDESVANKIAAGEVVERPASVVKELVENALDAGATSITVDAQEGGRRLIRVTDDGCGMCREDAILCLQRHATSKVRTAEDLVHIRTLGFRGEALPSIAAVSQLSLTTREHDDDEGTKVVAEAGEVIEVSPVGCPPGTSVEAKNLFFNTPARSKFLRSSATERSHIMDVVAWAAMGHPEVAIRLTHNDQVAFSSPAGADLKSVLATLYGKNAVRELIPVELESAGIEIHGFVSTPALSRVNRTYQSIFVNKRFVRSRSLSHALNEPYRALLPSGRYPVAAVHINIAPELVDPNVHPTKIEVRFSREYEVHSLLQQAVEAALTSANLIREVELTPGAGRRPEQAFQQALGLGGGPSASRDDLRVDIQARQRFDAPRGMQWRTPTEAEVEPFREELARKVAGVEPEPLAREEVPTRPASSIERSDQVRIIGQADATYILAEAGGSILLIDQHVAAERVIYERLLEQARAEKPASQALMVPLALELSHREAAGLQDHLATLTALGFEVEPFGGTSYLVRAIPLMLVGENYEAVLRDLLGELADLELSQALEDRRKEVITAVACHSAVKAGEALSDREMHQLVCDLLKTSSPAVCPHGRPIIVTLSLSELAKRFGRP